MASHIVINLADPDGIGPIAQLVAGLKKRREGLLASIYYGGGSIELVDGFALLDKDKKGTLKRSDPAVVELRRKCLAASKIYVATHGIATDVDNCFAKATGGASLATCSQLAQLLLLLLPKGKHHYLGLIMCYGARSSRYRSSDVNHEDMISAQDLATSFAYKLFRKLCVWRDITVSARTGAVGMTGPTGKTTVETEVTVDLQLDKKDLIVNRNGGALRSAYDNAKKVIVGIDQGMSWILVEQALSKNPDATVSTPNNAPNGFDALIDDVRAFYKFRNDVDVLTKQIQSIDAQRNKYGKFLYEYKNGRLKITNVYGSSVLDKGTVLYEGSLLG